MTAQFDKTKVISNEEVMSSIMELKNFIFDSNSRPKPKREEDSSSESYHRYKKREKYKRRSRKRDPTPSDNEDLSDESPAFSFNM